MLGAIAGDIIGSVYEQRPIKTTDFPLFQAGSRFTDDTVLTVAVAEVLLEGGDYVDAFHAYFRLYPDAGYGGTFVKWAAAGLREPYYSFGNGSAMRVSPVAYAFDTLEEVLAEARRSAEPTHDHPEGIRGAQAVAGAIFLARTGADKREIRRLVEEECGYGSLPNLAALRATYVFDVTCQGSVPPAVSAFLAAEDFEQAVRNAVSLGGDSDTLACMSGAIAEAHFGLPDHIADEALDRLPGHLRDTVAAFQDAFCRR